MMPQAVIFDVDGTIADTEEVHRQAFNATFAAFGLEWQWDAQLYGELLRTTGGKERITAYIERLPLPSGERHRLKCLAPQLHAAKTGRYRELIEMGDIAPRPGIRRLMAQARAAGVRLGIASTTSPQNIEPLLVAVLGAGSLGWFDVIATGDVVANKKPAPDIYQLALRVLGVRPHTAIAVEDSALGVLSAKAAGLFTVASPNGWTATQDFSAADLVLATLADLPDLEVTAWVGLTASAQRKRHAADR